MLTVNDYFDGKVKSIGFKSATLPATVGVMTPGEYEFSTSERETMRVITGIMKVCLPYTDSWRTFEAGEEFVVEANQKFQLEITNDTAYLCTYG